MEHLDGWKKYLLYNETIRDLKTTRTFWLQHEVSVVGEEGDLHLTMFTSSCNMADGCFIELRMIFSCLSDIAWLSLWHSLYFSGTFSGVFVLPVGLFWLPTWPESPEIVFPSPFTLKTDRLTSSCSAVLTTAKPQGKHELESSETEKARGCLKATNEKYACKVPHSSTVQSDRSNSYSPRDC